MRYLGALPFSSTRTGSRLLLLAAAMLFSTGGVAIKACSLVSWQVACARSGVAAVCLCVLLPNARRGWTWRTPLVGIAYAATLVLFVLATKLTTSANAIFLQSTGPLYMLLLGPLVLRERIQAVDWVTLPLVGVGAALLLSGATPAAASAPNPALGNLLALISGFTWALVITSLRWLGKHSAHSDGGPAAVVAGNVIACLFALPFAFPVQNVSVVDGAVVLYLGVVQIGVAYFALTRAIRHVPGLEASTIMLAEPVFNPVWTWMILGERPGSMALIGGAMIILTTLGRTWWQSRGGG